MIKYFNVSLGFLQTMAMRPKGNNRRANRSTSSNAPSRVQCLWWAAPPCFIQYLLGRICLYIAVHASCRSVLSLCSVSSIGAGPPWFWALRSCEAWRVFSTQPPCWTWRGCALLAHAASACSGSTSVRSFQSPVGARTILFIEPLDLLWEN